MSGLTAERAGRRASAFALLNLGDRAGLGAAVAAYGLAALLAASQHRRFIWVADLTPTFALAVVLLCAGLFARAGFAHRRWPLRFAAMAITLANLGFITLAMTTLNAAMLPLTFPLRDAFYVRLDALVGFDWPALVAWVSAHPPISRLLKVVYPTHVNQLILTILMLTLTGRLVQLQRFVVTGALASAATLFIWWLVPGFGPVAVHHLPQEIYRAALIPDAAIAHIGFLEHIATNGIQALHGDQMLGMIAFPSFHIVMAALATWSARGNWLFWLLLAVNVVMIPAALVQGLHHLIDLAGGLLLFAIVAAAAKRVVPGPGRDFAGSR